MNAWTKQVECNDGGQDSEEEEEILHNLELMKHRNVQVSRQNSLKTSISYA